MAKNKPQIGDLKNGMVYRFTKGFVVAHAVHTISFLTLLLTGLAIYVPSTSWIAVLFGGIQSARIIHRVMAVFYAIVAPLIMITKSDGQMKDWLKVAFTWKMEDILFMPKYIVTEFMGRHGDLPESDFINAGEKVNSLLTIFTLFGLTISGIIMWFPNVFPAWLVLVAYPLHDLSWMFMTCMLLVHMFLSLVHPKMRTALLGITKSWVPVEFAEGHYPKWFRRVTAGKKDVGA